jgi:hypothetical protein
MNAAIELHDSELASVNVFGKDVRIALRPAYIHKSLREPGVDTGTGWVQDIDLVIENGLVEGELSKLPVELGTGQLCFDGHSISNVLPLPLDRIGAVEVTLEPMWGGMVQVRGSRIRVELVGEAKYVEEF